MSTSKGEKMLQFNKKPSSKHLKKKTISFKQQEMEEIRKNSTTQEHFMVNLKNENGELIDSYVLDYVKFLSLARELLDSEEKPYYVVDLKFFKTVKEYSL